MKSPEMGHGQSENKPLNDSDAKELLEILPKAIENGTATFDPARSIIVKLKENEPLNDSDAKELLEILPKAIENGTATFDPARSIIVKLKEQLKSFPS